MHSKPEQSAVLRESSLAYNMLVPISKCGEMVLRTAEKKGTSTMALTTSIDAGKRICATCQFWQGERMPKWTPTRNVIVRYDGGIATCSAWAQKRGARFTCARYKRWMELP